MSEEEKMPKQEASADMRQLARMIRDMHVALLDEGFTENQSMQLLATTISAQIARGSD